LRIFFGIGYDFWCVFRQIGKEILIEWDENQVSNKEALE